MEENSETDFPPCPFCGYAGETIWIHGHGQCKNCTKNIEPCCEGRPLNQTLTQPLDKELETTRIK